MQAPEGRSPLDPEWLDGMSGFRDAIEELPEVDRVLSVLDLADEVKRAGGSNQNLRALFALATRQRRKGVRVARRTHRYRYDSGEAPIGLTEAEEEVPEPLDPAEALELLDELIGRWGFHVRMTPKRGRSRRRGWYAATRRARG